MQHLFSLLTHLQVSWLALAISLVTLILKLLEYRTKLAISQVYITEVLGGTQKVILTLSNESLHAVSITALEFENCNLETFKPKFGNYVVWSNESYTRYTDILPITFAPNESKLLIFEIDSIKVQPFSKIKISTVKKSFNLKDFNQSNISLDSLVTIR